MAGGRLLCFRWKMSPTAKENDPSAGVMRPYGKRHLTLRRNAIAERGGVFEPYGNKASA